MEKKNNQEKWGGENGEGNKHISSIESDRF